MDGGGDFPVDGGLESAAAGGLEGAANGGVDFPVDAGLEGATDGCGLVLARGEPAELPGILDKGEISVGKGDESSGDLHRRGGETRKPKNFSKKRGNETGEKGAAHFRLGPVFCHVLLGARRTQETWRTINITFNEDSRKHGAQGSDKHRMTIKTGHKGREAQDV